MKQLWKNEPVAVINTIAAIVALTLSLAVAFGAPLDESQKVAALTFVNGVAALLATLFGRSQVTPMAKLEDLAPRAARAVELNTPVENVAPLSTDNDTDHRVAQ